MALNVYYKSDRIDEKVDKAIEKALKPLGLRRWASGYNLVEGIRDLAFDSKVKNGQNDSKTF